MQLRAGPCQILKQSLVAKAQRACGERRTDQSRGTKAPFPRRLGPPLMNAQLGENSSLLFRLRVKLGGPEVLSALCYCELVLLKSKAQECSRGRRVLASSRAAAIRSSQRMCGWIWNWAVLACWSRPIACLLPCSNRRPKWRDGNGSGYDSRTTHHCHYRRRWLVLLRPPKWARRLKATWEDLQFSALTQR